MVAPARVKHVGYSGVNMPHPDFFLHHLGPVYHLPSRYWASSFLAVNI